MRTSHGTRTGAMRLLTTFTMLLQLLAFSGEAAAQEPSDAKELALRALNLEFFRDDVTATEPDLADLFKRSCDQGYQLACERRSWLVDGQANLQAAGVTFEKACKIGDPLACLVHAWALDEAAPASEDPERTYRAAALVLKLHCDAGYQPACHEYGGFLFENKGLSADPRSALLRWKPACDSGYLASCARLGELELEGAPGVAKNPRGALATFDATCKRGHPAACFAVGTLSDASWDAAKVHDWYSGLCDDGHRESCWKLGLLYQNRTIEPVTGDVPAAKDPSETKDALMLRGCELGHASACYEAGRSRTAGASPSWSEAAALFSAACRHGESDGCKELVDLQLEDRIEGGIKTDATAYDAACEREGHIGACTALALGLMTGVEVPRDPLRARQLLQRSCVDASSSPEACTALGRVFEDGIGGDRDRTEAARFYRWACYADRFDACDRRGDLLASGNGIKRDDLEALAMYQRACSGGIGAACHKGGIIVDEATYVTRDLVRASELYSTACEGGVASACPALGRVREGGVNGPPDFETARVAYEKGVSMDDVESRRRLARLLWNGLGGKRDKGRARALTREACQAGDPIACRGPEFL